MEYMNVLKKYRFNLQLFSDGGGDVDGGAEGAEGTDGADTGRTFTQAELNAIVQRRIAEVEGKYSDYDSLKEKASKYDEAEEASKTELQKAQDSRDSYKKKYEDLVAANAIRDIRGKVSEEKGVPANLLTASTEEECKKQADAILAFAGNDPNGRYPDVRDGGESMPAGANTPEAIFDRFMKLNFK